MIKTPIEEKLEASLYGLGIEFGERFYGEEIPIQSDAQDAINPIKVSDIERKYREASSPEERIMLMTEDLDEFQRLALHQRLDDIKLPLFMRFGMHGNQKVLVYYVYGLRRTEPPYKPIIDNIIKKGTEEHINVYGEGGERLGSINLSTRNDVVCVDDVDFNPLILRGYAERYDCSFEAMNKAVDALKRDELNPLDLYKPLIDFIKASGVIIKIDGNQIYES